MKSASESACLHTTDSLILKCRNLNDYLPALLVKGLLLLRKNRKKVNIKKKKKNGQKDSPIQRNRFFFHFSV